MPGKLFNRPIYIRAPRSKHYQRRPPRPRRQKLLFALTVVLALLLAIAIPSILYFRDLSGAIALSDATDLITEAINDIVLEKMSEPELQYSDFVTLERDNDGHISAIVTNMAQVNALSSELLNAVVVAADAGRLDLEVPLGNLLGIGILLSRGPDIPVSITMLTSSRAGFHNELVSAGINQTKHQVMLELYVDVNVLLPWEVLSTQVVVDVLVAETIIVGSVPDTYLNWENNDG